MKDTDIKSTEYALPEGAIPENIGEVVIVQTFEIGDDDDDEKVSDVVDTHIVGILNGYALNEHRFAIMFQGEHGASKFNLLETCVKIHRKPRLRRTNVVQ